MTPCPHDEHDFVIDIFIMLANENEMTLEQVKQNLLIHENESLTQRFWEILDIRLPRHDFTSMGCCAHCGSFELL